MVSPAAKAAQMEALMLAEGIEELLRDSSVCRWKPHSQTHSLTTSSQPCPEPRKDASRAFLAGVLLPLTDVSGF